MGPCRERLRSIPHTISSNTNNFFYCFRNNSVMNNGLIIRGPLYFYGIWLISSNYALHIDFWKFYFFSILLKSVFTSIISLSKDFYIKVQGKPLQRGSKHYNFSNPSWNGRRVVTRSSMQQIIASQRIDSMGNLMQFFEKLPPCLRSNLLFCKHGYHGRYTRSGSLLN